MLKQFITSMKVLLLMGIPLLLKAQPDNLADYWNVTAHIGPYASGIPRNLNKTMVAHQFRTPSFFGISGGSERMIHNKPVFSVAIERVTSGAWSGKFSLSSLQGRVAGFAARYGDLRIAYSQVAVAFLAGYHSRKRTTRIAAGPSLSFINIQTEGFSSTSFRQNNTKAGFVVEAGLRFPARGRLFIDINSQYQFAGKQELGTYDFGSNGRMHVGKKSANCLSFNFGIGLRFGKKSFL